MSQVIGSFGFYLNGLNVANVTPTFFFSKIALQKYKYHPSKTQKITYGGRIMSKVLVCTLLLNKYLKCVVNEDILREQLLLMGEPKGGDHFLSSNSSNTNISLLAQLKWQLLRANIWLFGFLALLSLCQLLRKHPADELGGNICKEIQKFWTTIFTKVFGVLGSFSLITQKDGSIT